jgi:prepilin-type N-terminal cleavage/methylation domain-containing protein
MSRPGAQPGVERGMTLVELLVTITVIAVAGLALVGTMGYLAGNSGDSVAQMQAHAVADAFLSETLANSYPTVVGRTATEGSMQVSVAVTNSGALFNVPAAAAKRVDVTVTLASGQRVIATGYRLSYP